MKLHSLVLGLSFLVSGYSIAQTGDTARSGGPGNNGVPGVQDCSVSLDQTLSGIEATEKILQSKGYTIDQDSPNKLSLMLSKINYNYSGFCNPSRMLIGAYKTAQKTERYELSFKKDSGEEILLKGKKFKTLISCSFGSDKPQSPTKVLNSLPDCQ